MPFCPNCRKEIEENTDVCRNCNYPIGKILGDMRASRTFCFDLARVRSLDRGMKIYFPLDDDRWGVAISDETHKILTTILNHYIINDNAVCLQQTTIIRDRIISDSNLAPIADLWLPYTVARNRNQETFTTFKDLISRIQKITETGVIRDYLDWLLNEPFINVKIFTDELAKVKIMDPSWSEVLTLDSGHCEYQVELLPIEDTAIDFNYIFYAHKSENYSLKKIKIRANQEIQLIPGTKEAMMQTQLPWQPPYPSQEKQEQKREDEQELAQISNYFPAEQQEKQKPEHDHAQERRKTLETELATPKKKWWQFWK